MPNSNNTIHFFVLLEKKLMCKYLKYVSTLCMLCLLIYYKSQQWHTTAAANLIEKKKKKICESLGVKNTQSLHKKNKTRTIFINISPFFSKMNLFDTTQQKREYLWTFWTIILQKMNVYLMYTFIHLVHWQYDCTKWHFTCMFKCIIIEHFIKSRCVMAFIVSPMFFFFNFTDQKGKILFLKMGMECEREMKCVLVANSYLLKLFSLYIFSDALNWI